MGTRTPTRTGSLFLSLDMARAPWERQGRGLAVFGWTGARPPRALTDKPGSALLTPSDPPALDGTPRRIILHGFTEQDFDRADDLNRLICLVVLPARRRRIPLYLFTACPFERFAPASLPLTDHLALDETFVRLFREQLRTLLLAGCAMFPAPGAPAVPMRARKPAARTGTPAPRPALSPEQARCLEPQEGPVLTLAPAGSGKTRVLTRRVVEAVRNGVHPARVLCVVFNKDASEVMKTRIHREVGLPDVRICTLHSLGYDICRNAPDSRYAGFRVVTPQALPGGVRGLFREALKADIAQTHRRRGTPQLRIFPEHLVTAYETSAALRKTTLAPAGTVPEGVVIEGFDESQAARVSRRVEEELRRRRLITFDDQIYCAVETLLASPAARRRYQGMFDVVLADEVQDLTRVQFLLVRLLAMPLQNLFAVGDDDQMINSFAGADPSNIRDFQRIFPGAVIHTLGENHRCTPDIVIRSANLIACNRNRFAKPIRPAAGSSQNGTESPVAIRVFRGRSLEAQTRAVVEQIDRWRCEGFAYGDMAILMRVKSIAAFVQHALTRTGIPFQPLEQARFFSSPPGRTLAAYLEVCRDPASAAPDAFNRALAVPTRYLSNHHLRRIAVEGWRLVQRPAAFPPDAQAALRAFNETVGRIHRRHRRNPRATLEWLDDILRHFPIEAHYDRQERARRRTVVSSSSDIIAAIRQLAQEYPAIDAFMDFYRQRMREEQETPAPATDGADKVRLSTMHSSKGEEYRAVVIFHATEHTIPHRRMAADPADIEEERRVFYVALTRAVERLLITADAAQPSRFLAELDRSQTAHRKRRFRRAADRLRRWIGRLYPPNFEFRNYINSP